MAAAGNARTTRFTTPSDTEFVMTRVVDAPRELVFDAYTKPEHVPNWLLGPEGWTMPICEIDLRPGGSWHFVWRHRNGDLLEMRGVYREIVRPERLVNTESWGADWPETLNTLTFTEHGGATTIEQHVRYESKRARDAAMATGMSDGAAQSFRWLDAYLAARTSRPASRETSPGTTR